MPNDNKTTATNSLPPVFVDQGDLPPMINGNAPPVPSTDIANPSPATVTGSATPTNDMVTGSATPTVVTITPKKKFAGGKIIASILGLLLLIGGASAGFYLTRQNQNPSELAWIPKCGPGDPDCKDGPPPPNPPEPPPDEDPPPPPTPGGPCNVCQNEKCVTKPYGCVPDAGCNSDNDCKTPVPPPPPSDDTVCGRDKDRNAPVCCPGGKKFNCPKAPVCEPPNRLECDRGAEGYCTMEVGGCTAPPPPDEPAPTIPPTPVPTPSVPPITAQCQNIKAYSEAWVLLTATQLSNLKPTNKVNFCVTGVATGGSFDKGKFTINGSVQAETTLVRPSSTDFCQLYTIPTAITTFNITAQIHHVTLGWK